MSGFQQRTSKFALIYALVAASTLVRAAPVAQPDNVPRNLGFGLKGHEGLALGIGGFFGTELGESGGEPEKNGLLAGLRANLKSGGFSLGLEGEGDSNFVGLSASADGTFKMSADADTFLRKRGSPPSRLGTYPAQKRAEAAPEITKHELSEAAEGEALSELERRDPKRLWKHTLELRGIVKHSLESMHSHELRETLDARDLEQRSPSPFVMKHTLEPRGEAIEAEAQGEAAEEATQDSNVAEAESTTKLGFLDVASSVVSHTESPQNARVFAAGPDTNHPRTQPMAEGPGDKYMAGHMHLRVGTTVRTPNANV
ncbi:hypothetical protein HGRIS_014300 [Hohenbuehelia grisea]|uniref:Secreted protein n=1 Tax=Hohenbuehelia grisea TaxID=104357 RepID=A0ABR3JSZ3_9AGAR